MNKARLFSFLFVVIPSFPLAAPAASCPAGQSMWCVTCQCAKGFTPGGPVGPSATPFSDRTLCVESLTSDLFKAKKQELDLECKKHQRDENSKVCEANFKNYPGKGMFD